MAYMYSMHLCADARFRALDATGEIDVIQTTFVRALASPHRLRIIRLLGGGPRDVNELVCELGLNQATVSQHLSPNQPTAAVGQVSKEIEL